MAGRRTPACAKTGASRLRAGTNRRRDRPMSTAAAIPALRPRLWKAFLVFLGPMMLANILQALSGTINNVYLGQMLGVHAMAAVSAFFPILFFFISFMVGLGAGASVLIGQAWGARERERVKAIAGTTLTVGLIIGLLVAVFGGALTGPMLRLLHTPADILPQTTAYARIMLIAAPGIFVFLLVTSMLRGVSDTVSPLITLAVSTAIGLVLTPALIRGWGGLPQMGVASGAWAAVASYAVGLAWHMLRRNHPLAPDAVFLRHMKIDRAILARVLRIGLPTAMQVITMSLAEVAVLFLVNRFGSDATAAYGAVNQVMSYVQFPAMSIAITASILGAQAIGAGRTSSLGAIARTGILMNLVLTGGLVLLAYLFSRTLIGLFITSAPVVDITQTLLHIMLWSLIVYGMAAVLS